MKENIKIFSAFLVFAILMWGCGLCSSVDKVTHQKTVKYEVTGTSGLVSITIQNSSGGHRTV
jgi:hypothetical protein